MKNSTNKICRICYNEEESPDDPLLQPCNCSGSMKYIHLSCLKQWLNTRMCVKIDSLMGCSIYMEKSIECELCKTKYPDCIRHKGQLYPLIEFNSEFKNYLALESLTKDKKGNKFIYVISLDKDQIFKAGRGQDCEILLSDISVSRIHCFFIIDKKNVFIQDNDSKFGTLILVQAAKMQIGDNLPIHLQIGRTYLTCLLKKEESFFNCCNASDKSNLFYYYQQNEKAIMSKEAWTIKTENDSKSSEYVKKPCQTENLDWDNNNKLTLDDSKERNDYCITDNNVKIIRKEISAIKMNGTMISEDDEGMKNDVFKDNEEKKEENNMIQRININTIENSSAENENSNKSVSVIESENIITIQNNEE